MKVRTEPNVACYAHINVHEPARRVERFGDIASNTDPARTALLPADQRDRLTVKYDKAKLALGG